MSRDHARQRLGMHWRLNVEPLESRWLLSGSPTDPDASGFVSAADVTLLATSTNLTGPTSASVGQVANYTATVTASGATVDDGVVSLLDGTTVIGTATVDSSGVATFPITGLSAGPHTISASYAGTTAFDVSTSKTINLNVNKLGDSISAYWSTPLAGQALTINAGIFGTLLIGTPRTGTLTLSEGSTSLASVDISQANAGSNGYFALSVPSGLAKGSHSLKITYSGDANYNTASSNITLNVLNDSLSLSYGSTALVGAPYTVDAKINGALVDGNPRTGTLSFLEGTTTLANVDVSTVAPSSSGYYALTLSGGFAAGTHGSLKVSYSGDANYSAVTAGMGVVNAVNSVNTTTSLSGPTSVATGQQAYFSAYVNAPGFVIGTGTVTFYDGTTALATVPVNATGAATFQTSALTKGSHSITASYDGTNSFNTSVSRSLSVNVTGVYDYIGLSYSTPLAGQAWTLNAGLFGTLVANTPRTGTLTLSEGTTTLATVDISQVSATNSYYALAVPGGLSLGTHALKVTYSGDSVYAGASASLSLNVLNDSLSIGYSSVALAGQPYTVTARINGPLVNDTPRTGTLSLVEGTNTLTSIDISQVSPSSSGYYALTLSGGLTAGTHAGMKVTYSGDSNYSAVSVGMATVNSAASLNTTTSLSGPTSMSTGLPATFTARVYASGATVGTGTVTFTDGTNVLGVVNVNGLGVATYQTSTLTLGTHSIKATYDGTTSFNTSTSLALNVNVTGVYTYVSSYYSTPLAGQVFTLNSGIFGTVLANTPRTGTLTLSEGSTTLASMDISQVAASSTGYYALSVPAGFAVGQHSLKVSYSGDATYAASASTITLNILNDTLSLSYNSTALVGQPYTVSAKIGGSLVNGAARTGTLSLVEGSMTLTSVDITQVSANSSGYYALTLDGGLPAGTHAGMKVTYSGDANYSAVTGLMANVNSVSSVNTTTSLSGPTSVSSGNQAIFTARVYASGVTVNAGTVTFTDGTTVLGTVPVNSTGVATYQTSTLTQGLHSIKATFDGTSTFNTSASSALNVNVTGVYDYISSYYSTIPLADTAFTINAGIFGTLVSGTPRTGTLTLTEGTTTLGSIDVGQVAASTTGYYAFSLPNGLSMGQHTLKLTYSGDGSYAPATSTLSLNILNDTLSLSYNSTALVGQPYTVSAKIGGPIINGASRTGTLSLLEGSNTLTSIDVSQVSPSSSGYYALTLSGGLPAGTHTGMKVTYSGDATYSAVTYNMANISSVTSVNTTTSLSGPTTVSSGVQATFNAYVYGSGVAVNAGTVTFTDGAITLATVPVNATGVASYQTNTLPQGLHSIKATYNGASTFNTSTSSALNVSVTGVYDYINSYYSTTPLADTPFTINAGIFGTLISGTPRTGTLTLSEGTTTLGSFNVGQVAANSSGYYAFSMPSGLPLGQHTLKLTYTGDSNYAAASSTLSLNILNDTLSLSYASATLAGQPYTVSARIGGPIINGAPRTGTLSLVEGSTTLASVDLSQVSANSSGYYALTLSGGLPAGTHTGMKVTYSGDTIYSANTALMGTINSATTLNTSTYLSAPTTVSGGQMASFTASVSASGYTVNSGTVTFYDGTTALATVNVGATGSATYQTNTLAKGTHAIKATFDGTTSLNTSTSSTVNVTVNGFYTSLGASWSTPQPGQAFTLNTSINGTLISGTPRTGTLTLSEGTTTLASIDISQVVANSSGYYALSVPAGFTAGTHSLKATYSGDANYNGASISLTVNVLNDSLSLSYATTAAAGQVYTVKAKIGGNLVNNTPRTGTLTLVEGSTVLATVDVLQATTDANGYFLLTLNNGLTAGSHYLKVVYSGDAIYTPVTYYTSTINVT